MFRSFIVLILLIGFNTFSYGRSPAVDPVLELSSEEARPIQPNNHLRGFRFPVTARAIAAIKRTPIQGKTKWPQLITIILLGLLPIALRFALFSNFKKSSTVKVSDTFEETLNETIIEESNVISLADHKKQKEASVITEEKDEIKKAS